MPEGTWPILTYAAKWHVGSAGGSRQPPCLSRRRSRSASPIGRARLAETGAGATMQGKGYGRVDIRVDDAGKPWILEVNPNPDLTDAAGLSRMAKARGVGVPGAGPSHRRSWRCAKRRARRPRVSCSLRPVGHAHRARFEQLTRETGLFREEEVATAVELLDESLGGDERLPVPRRVRRRSARRIRVLGPHARHRGRRAISTGSWSDRQRQGHGHRIRAAGRGRAQVDGSTADGWWSSRPARAPTTRRRAASTSRAGYTRGRDDPGVLRARRRPGALYQAI